MTNYVIEDDEVVLRKHLTNSTLEKAVVDFYCGSLNPRPLFGDNSIISRTIGENFNGIERYNKIYFDKYRQDYAETEFSEFVTAFHNYSITHEDSDAIEMLLEYGDLVFQDIAVDLIYGLHGRHDEAKKLIGEALYYAKKSIESYGFDANTALELSKVKYGCRTFKKSNGRKVKDKETEKRFCEERFKELISK